MKKQIGNNITSNNVNKENLCETPPESLNLDSSEEKVFIINFRTIHYEENPSEIIPCMVFTGENVDCSLSADQAGLSLCLDEAFDTISYAFDCKYILIPFQEILCPLSYFTGMHYEILHDGQINYLFLHMDDFNRQLIRKNAKEALAYVKRPPIHFTYGSSTDLFFL